MNRWLVCASVIVLTFVVPVLAADDYDRSGAEKLGGK